MPEQDVGTLARISQQEQIHAQHLKIRLQVITRGAVPKARRAIPNRAIESPAKTSDYEFALKNRIGHPEITLYSSHRQGQIFSRCRPFRHLLLMMGALAHAAGACPREVADFPDHQDPVFPKRGPDLCAP